MNESNLPSSPYPPAPHASAPGVSAFAPMAPMHFGQILDRVYRLMRSHIRPFAGIGLLPIGALFAFYAVFAGALALAGVFSHPHAQPNPVAIAWAMAPLLILGIPATFLFYGLYYGAASYAALQADHGVQVTVSEAFRVAWSKAGRFVWLIVLRSLILALPILLCWFAVFAGALLLGLVPNGNANTAALFFLIPLGILLYLGSLVYAVIMSLRLSLAYPACVYEGLTAYQAIKRSGVLTQGAKGRIFLVLLVIYAIGYVLFMVFYAVVLFVIAIGALAGAGHIHAPWSYIGLGLLGVCALGVILLWSVILMASYSTAFAVFYRDQCLRKDGLLPAPAQAGEPA